MKFLQTLIISLGLMLSVGIASASELQETEGAVVTPALKLESLKGEALDLKDFEGQVVLVQFWATYCTPCRVEMPSMNNLIKKLEESKTPFKILAVNMAETKEEVQAFVDEVKPEFTILMGKEEDIQTWKVFAAPSNFVIGPKGKIRYTLYGGVEWDSDEITATIQKLAEEIEKEG